MEYTKKNDKYINNKYVENEQIMLQSSLKKQKNSIPRYCGRIPRCRGRKKGNFWIFRKNLPRYCGPRHTCAAINNEVLRYIININKVRISNGYSQIIYITYK